MDGLVISGPVLDLNRLSWEKIAELCPIQCQISHTRHNEVEEIIDDRGEYVWQPIFRFISGTLSVSTDLKTGYLNFRHPGFLEKAYAVHPWIVGELPINQGIRFRSQL